MVCCRRSRSLVAGNASAAMKIQCAWRSSFHGAVVSTEKELVVDGFFGAHSTAVLQSVLTQHGFPTGPIDGRFGCKTKKALQTFLRARGYDVDACGRFGCKTKRALQVWAQDQGADPGPVDGCWGRRTSSALQTVLRGMQCGGSAVAKPLLVKEPSAKTETLLYSTADALVALAGVAPTVGVPLFEGISVPDKPEVPTA